MRKLLLPSSWFILAGFTLFFVVTQDYPSWLVALTAWTGGIGTAMMWKDLRSALYIRKTKAMLRAQRSA